MRVTSSKEADINHPEPFKYTHSSLCPYAWPMKVLASFPGLYRVFAHQFALTKVKEWWLTETEKCFTDLLRFSNYKTKTNLKIVTPA